MSVEIEINMQLIKALEEIPIRLRSGPLGACLKAYGQPIAEYAKNIAPRSKNAKAGSPASGPKRSAKAKAKWAANESGNHYSVKPLRSGVGVIVGATYPRGNKQQFVHPYKKGDTYEHELWGKKRTTIRYPRSEQPVVKASRAVQSQAEAAFLTQLQKEIKELRLG